jgi:hypothetical protein
VIAYVLSGQIIVDFVRWLIVTGGNVAESAFLLATLYVTLNNVAHILVAWLLPPQIIEILNQISVIAFSVLPELIAISAIKLTFDHWVMYSRSKRKDALLWSTVYTVPTVVFVVMTVLTLASFVSVESLSAIAPTATGTMLVIRCLAGWFYALIQMLFAQIGKDGYGSHLAILEGDLATVRSDLAIAKGHLITLEGDLARIVGDLENKIVALKTAHEKEVTSLKVKLTRKSPSSKTKSPSKKTIRLLRTEGE